MALETDTPNLTSIPAANTVISGLYEQGIVAGILGAATIAVWFFLVDLFNGQPFYTPNVLGTALFRSGTGLDQPQNLPISLEMVLVYTCHAVDRSLPGLLVEPSKEEFKLADAQLGLITGTGYGSGRAHRNDRDTRERSPDEDRAAGRRRRNRPG